MGVDSADEARKPPVVMRVISDRQWPNETGAPDLCLLQPCYLRGLNGGSIAKQPKLSLQLPFLMLDGRHLRNRLRCILDK